MAIRLDSLYRVPYVVLLFEIYTLNHKNFINFHFQALDKYNVDKSNAINVEDVKKALNDVCIESSHIL